MDYKAKFEKETGNVPVVGWGLIDPKYATYLENLLDRQREYMTHKDECIVSPNNPMYDILQDCTCGLDDLIQE